MAELPTYMSDYKWLFHDAAEEYEFAHTLERPGQRGYWLANFMWKSVVFMRGELLRFSNKSDFYCDSQMVLPGGSDISSGEGFVKKKTTILHLAFKS